MDGGGDTELDGTLQRHGLEVGEAVAPKLGMSLEKLIAGGGRHHIHECRADLRSLREAG